MTLLVKPGWNGLTEPEAVAYITAVEAADGQLIEFAVAKAVNDFVLGCKADRIWDPIKACCILAGARTLNGALVPLVGAAPTNVNFTSGDYNRKTGLVGDGSTKRLNSNRAGNADPQNSSHIFAYLSSATNQNTNIISLTDTGSGRKQITRPNDFPGNLLTRSNSSIRVDITGAGAATGSIGISRNNPSSYTGRALGASSTLTANSEGTSSNNLFIYGDAAHSNARIAFYSIGEALDLALLDARVTTLINTFAAVIP